MNRALLIAVALVVCAVAVRGDEESPLANVETVEPTFLEADAASSPLFQLPPKLAKTTVEPRYYGEKPAPKKYVSPEYQDPKPVQLSRKERKNQPVLFTSHYFSPLPKKVNGKKLRVSRQKRGRVLVPFRATVETPAGHRRHKGFTEAELWDGRLPNKYDDPRQNMKKTKAPAPQLSLLEAMAAAQDGLEADTTDEAELEAENAPVPPPFQHDEGEQVATIVESAEGFFDQNYQPPTWKDEEATESELLEAGAEVEMSAAEKAAARATKTHIAAFAGVEVDQSKLPRLVPVAPHVSAEEAVEQYNDLSAFLEAEQAKSSFVEVAEETEDEAEDEAEDEEESDEEESEESEDESEEEADEEADDEAEEEVVEEVSLVETAGAADESDSVDAEMDEMAQNEAAAAQVDMDATSDEAAMAEGQEITETTVEEVDSDEASSAEEADSAEEEVTEAEAVEDAEVADAVSLMEVNADAEEVDTLLSEIDAHLSSDSDAETQTEAEGEAETQAKGTPGSRIAAGQTWEEHQNERLNAMEQQLAAEKAAAPKVAAQVVSAEQLSAVDAEHQVPAYDSAEAAVETVEPELLVEQSAQATLKAKIAQLKAINRS